MGGHSNQVPRAGSAPLVLASWFPVLGTSQGPLYLSSIKLGNLPGLTGLEDESSIIIQGTLPGMQE